MLFRFYLKKVINTLENNYEIQELDYFSIPVGIKEISTQSSTD